MIKANEAIEIAENKTGRKAIRCTEYSDSYVIDFFNEISIGGFMSPIVVMKDTGHPMQMHQYVEISDRNPNEIGIIREL